MPRAMQHCCDTRNLTTAAPALPDRECFKVPWTPRRRVRCATSAGTLLYSKPLFMNYLDSSGIARGLLYCHADVQGLEAVDQHSWELLSETTNDATIAFHENSLRILDESASRGEFDLSLSLREWL